MNEISRILVPVDFSARSQRAVRYACSMASCFESNLLVVHVVEPLQFEFSMVEPSRQLLDEAVAGLVADAQGRLDALPVPLNEGRVRRVVTRGDAAEQILEVSRQENASLVVMPTQGRSRIRQFLIGSVTGKVLHD